MGLGLVISSKVQMCPFLSMISSGGGGILITSKSQSRSWSVVESESVLLFQRFLTEEVVPLTK